MRRLAGDLHLHEHAALAAAHHVAARPARLGVEHRAGAARLGLDDRPAGGRADLLVRGEQPDQRRRRAAELLECREHERIHHQARLHVGDARAVGLAVLDPERAARRLALGKHRVAMAHQHDGGVRRPADGRAQRVAIGLVRDRLAGDLVALEEMRGCARRPRRRPPCRRSRRRCSRAPRAARASRPSGRRAIPPQLFSPCTPDVMNGS